ncbi:MAG: prolyl oligopeptidase family serine peptidase [Verrucomicrobiota bacterium]
MPSSPPPELSPQRLRRQRTLLVAIMGIPIIIFLLAYVFYDIAMRSTSIGQLGLNEMNKYPETKREDIVEEIFGQKVADPYRWLEDEDAPEVEAWVGRQEKLTRAYLDSLPQRLPLAERFKELFYIDAISAPVKRGDRYFYRRRHADKEKVVHYWREGLDGEERVLLDPNTMGGDGENIALGTVVPDWQGKNVAYAVRPNAADESTLYVMNVETREVSEIDVIEGAKYAYPSWTPDGSGFFYTWLPEVEEDLIDERPGMAVCKFHRLGTDPANDPVVRPATGNPQTFQGVYISRDGQWLMHNISHGWVSDDVYLANLGAMPLAAVGPSLPTEQAWTPWLVGTEHKYWIEHWDGHFYILTDDGAPQKRLFRTKDSAIEREHWQEIVPAREDAVIDDFSIIGNRLVVTTLQKAANRLEIYELDGTKVRDERLPQLGEVFGVTGNPDQDQMFYGFSSFAVPFEIYRTSAKDGGSELWAKTEFPVDAGKFTVKQVEYKSKDGTPISMFLVLPENTYLNGNTPFLLYGYGGFGVNLGPGFMSSIIPWLEAGGGFAMPNLRGGGEYGEDWHRAGMRHNKQNTFDDFIAAAEYLCNERYTSPDRLSIRGGSNGGLLVGAAVTQAPKLFRAAICSVPLLDMVRYHLYGSGRTWMPEYGDPEKREDFEILVRYSPYHRLEKGADYPAMLLMSSAHDDRVDPMHARKFAAALQFANNGQFPQLLRIEPAAGHAGADRVESSVNSSADALAFLMAQMPRDSMDIPRQWEDQAERAQKE